MFFLAFFITVCQPALKKEEEKKARVITENQEEEETDQKRSRKTSCGRNSSRSDFLSVRDLDFVDASNVGAYELKGQCETRNRLIVITVNGYKISENPKCNRGRWKVKLDLSAIADEDEDRMVFHLSHDEGELCKEVRVSFLGPKNYIPISSKEDYYESGFYVMKYEAKVANERSANAKAISLAEGRPLLRVSYEDARDLCQNNGSRYDLISNLQWQNVALSIESMDENWSHGRASPADGNLLNCGLSRGIPRAASLDDEDDCAVSSCQSGWDENRRTHLLENGQKIWDMCGGVGEIMRDKYRKSLSFDDYVYNLPSSLNKIFGPKRNYKVIKASRRSNTWNLGYAKINSGKELIIRGAPGRFAGIFSADVTRDHDSRRGFAGNIGFRCVYNP